MTWVLYDLPDEVHVAPKDDLYDHELITDCLCGPVVEFVDPETGITNARTFVSHESLDGRE